MSCDVRRYQLKIDGKVSNAVLNRYKDIDGESYKNNLDNGYYPLGKESRVFLDEDIIKKVAKSFPDSEIFWNIVTEYGEEAYLYKDGKIKKLKKGWS